MGFFASLFGSRTPSIFTGRVISAADLRTQLPNGFLAELGKRCYAEVNSAAVVSVAQQTQAELWRRAGITKWDKRATCTLFASRFASLAAELFFDASFHVPVDSAIAKSGALSLAAGECWFHPDGQPIEYDHAIGVCLTERGPLWIDPQAPSALRPMSDNEIASSRCRFL